MSRYPGTSVGGEQQCGLEHSLGLEAACMGLNLDPATCGVNLGVLLKSSASQRVRLKLGTMLIVTRSSVPLCLLPSCVRITRTDVWEALGAASGPMSAPC